MGKVIVTDTYLSNIASAIRGRAGTASLYTPAQMASAIANIPSGVSVSALSVSANGTYSAPSGYAYDPVTVDVQGGGGGGGVEDGIIERTISGTYTNANVSTIGASVFANCIYLESVYFPNVSVVNSGAFAYCTSLTDINFPNADYFSNHAFYSCNKLKNVNAPNVSGLSNYAFWGTSITSITMQLLESIGTYTFTSCSHLSFVSLPSLISMGSYAFANCKSLITVNLPTYNKTINQYAFQSCTSLITINAPNAKNLGSYAFASCSALKNVNTPNVKTVFMQPFTGCVSLSTLSFPVLSAIFTSAFWKCYNLLSIYLLGSSVATLSNVNAFSSTPISTYTTSTGGVYGSIYVRASLYQDWITATNWSVYSARFVSMTDEEIAELDAQQ